MKTRPDLPVDRRTFGEWTVLYRAQLIDWFEATHGHRNPSINEWSKFALAVFNAQIEDEWEFARDFA